MKLFKSSIAAVVRWSQKWTAWNSADLRNCGDETVECLAHELGLSTFELRQLARKGAHAADLLVPRMAALDLDPKEVCELEPMVMHDMQRVCSMCQSHSRCFRDLKRDSDDPVWREYCSNAGTLMALDGMRKIPF